MGYTVQACSYFLQRQLSTYELRSKVSSSDEAGWGWDTAIVLKKLEDKINFIY